MQRFRSSTMLVACFGLLAAQLSGLHMHVNANGYAGTPQGTHVHRQATHGHGDDTHLDHRAPHGHRQDGDQSHDGDRDVSIIELSMSSSKLAISPVLLGLSLFIPLPLDERLSPYSAVPRPVGRHERWRPPLRAPPSL